MTAVDIAAAVTAAGAPAEIATAVAGWVGQPSCDAAHVTVVTGGEVRTLDGMFACPGGLVWVRYGTHAAVEAVPYRAVRRVAVELNRPEGPGQARSQVVIELAGGQVTGRSDFAWTDRSAADGTPVTEGISQATHTPAGWVREGSAADMEALAAAVRRHLLR